MLRWQCASWVRGPRAAFSHEDRLALHRLVANEAYQVGEPGHPAHSNLDSDALIATRCDRARIRGIHGLGSCHCQLPVRLLIGSVA